MVTCILSTKKYSTDYDVELGVLERAVKLCIKNSYFISNQIMSNINSIGPQMVQQGVLVPLQAMSSFFIGSNFCSNFPQMKNYLNV